MEISEEQLAKVIAITTCFVMNEYGDTLDQQELIEIKESATNDTKMQIKKKIGVYDIDAMFEMALSTLKPRAEF